MELTEKVATLEQTLIQLKEDVEKRITQNHDQDVSLARLTTSIDALEDKINQLSSVVDKQSSRMWGLLVGMIGIFLTMLGNIIITHGLKW